MDCCVGLVLQNLHLGPHYFYEVKLKVQLFDKGRTLVSRGGLVFSFPSKPLGLPISKTFYLETGALHSSWTRGGGGDCWVGRNGLQWKGDFKRIEGQCRRSCCVPLYGPSIGGSISHVSRVAVLFGQTLKNCIFGRAVWQRHIKKCHGNLRPQTLSKVVVIISTVCSGIDRQFPILFRVCLWMHLTKRTWNFDGHSRNVLLFNDRVQRVVQVDSRSTHLSVLV